MINKSRQVDLLEKALQELNVELTGEQKQNLADACNIRLSTAYNYLNGNCAWVDKGREIVTKGREIVLKAINEIKSIAKA